MSSKKCLIYFVVGGEPGYVELLRYCMQSVRNFPENDQYDLMVMCDAEYVKHVDSANIPRADIHITPHNKNGIWASMRKTEIFRYKRIAEYDRVLFLDSDIYVCAPLEPLFDMVALHDKLYTGQEGGYAHDQWFYSRGDRKYTPQEIAAFKAKGITTFNAGQFVFSVNDTMRDHFETIAREKDAFYDERHHCFEQSFMNDHFNRIGGADTSTMTKHVAFFAQRNLNDAKRKILAHFCDGHMPWVKKLGFMKQLHDLVWCDNGGARCAVLDSRAHIGTAVKLPAMPTIAEIGTFRGGYAEVLHKTYSPVSTLYLIDPWHGRVVSGDQDGNNVQTFQGEELHKGVVEHFGKAPEVKVLRKFSTDVTEIGPGSLDLLYIDGDHSYDGVKRDLELAWKWVKRGGWICGHDYAMNHAKTKNNYDFGVKRAVTEFCRQYGLRLHTLMNDGCVSFGIRF